MSEQSAPSAAQARPLPALVQHLVRLSANDDRGALATLRRAASDSVDAALAAAPHVAPYIPAETHSRGEWPYYAVAGLFALYPRHKHDGSTVGDLAAQLGSHGSAELRFRTLLGTSRDAVLGHLRSLFKQAQAVDAPRPVDFARLLADLRAWEHPDRYVQRQWARAYWRDQDSKSEPGRLPQK